jgi:hypothetical protein
MFAEMARAMERAGMPADQSVERGRRMTSGANDGISAAVLSATATDQSKSALSSQPQHATKSGQPAPRGDIHEREIASQSADSAHGGDADDSEQVVDDAFFNQSGADAESGDEEPLAHLTIGASFIQPASFRWSNEDLGEDGSENGDDEGYGDEDEDDEAAEGDDGVRASRDRVRMSSAASTAAPIMQINIWDHSADADAGVDLHGQAPRQPSQSQSQSGQPPQQQTQPQQQQVYIMPQPARAPPSVMQHHWRAELSPFARCHATIVQLTAANSAVKEFLNGAKWVQLFEFPSRHDPSRKAHVALPVHFLFPTINIVFCSKSNCLDCFLRMFLLSRFLRGNAQADLQPSSENDDVDDDEVEAESAESEPMDELDAHAAAEEARADAAFEDAKADNRSVHLSRRGALLAQIRPYAMALCASPLFCGNASGSSGVSGFSGGSAFDAIATDLTELVSLLAFNQPVPFLNEPEWRLVALTLLVLLGDRPLCAPALRPRGLCAASIRGGTERAAANSTGSVASTNPSQQSHGVGSGGSRSAAAQSDSGGGIHALLRELQFEVAHLECLVDAVRFDY